jgi:hypothetical protein
MNESNQLREQDVSDTHPYAIINRGKIDLVVLRYMAQKVRTMVHLLDTSASPTPALMSLV